MSRCLLLLSVLFGVIFSAATVVADDRSNHYAKNINQSSISNHSNHSALPVRLNPDKSVDVLIRLQDDPLVAFQIQQRAKLGGVQQKLSANQQQALDKAVISHREKLRRNQLQVINTLQQRQQIGKVRRQFVTVGNLISTTVKAGDIAALRQLPEVAAVYLEREHRALLEDSVAAVGAPQVWNLRDGLDRTVTGQSMRVAILDTGIDYTHPDLGGCVGNQCKVIAGVDFSGMSYDGEEALPSEENDFRDYNGHGTHVAGIVAANGQLQGVAPDARLYAVKVLGDSGVGSTTGVIAGVEWALDPDGDPTTDDGAHVMNLSLGGGIDEVLDEAVNTAMEAGVMVVVAAGNNGRYNSIDSPGSARNVITVGAIDKEDGIANFSSRGPVLGDYIKPDLVAPGVAINSTWLNGAYKPLQGTSMASPHVAGAAALLRQLHPQLSTAEIKALLVNRSRPLALDIFTQGAGAMDILASAQSQWLLTPSTLLMGRFTPEDVSETLEVSLTVKNLGVLTSQLDLEKNGPVITGTQLTITGDIETPITPGEERQLAVSLAVDNAALPFADNQSLHHESYASVNLGDDMVRLPFALLKSALLKLQMESILDVVLLLDESGDNTRFITPLDCNDEPEERELSVRPGNYKIIWIFADEPCYAGHKMVFAEDFQVDNVLSLEASANEAIYELGAQSIMDHQGKPLNIDAMSLDHACVNLWHPVMEFLYFSCGVNAGGNPRQLLMTNVMPDDYVLDYALVLSGEGDADKINHRNLYLFSDKIDNGLSASRKVTLDLADTGHTNLNVINPDWNGFSVEADVSLVKPLGVDGKTSINYSGRISGVFSLPASFTLYGGLSRLELSEWFAGVRLRQTVEDQAPEDYFFKKPLLVTGPVGFIDAGSFFKFTPEIDRLHVYFQSQDNQSYVLQRGYYFSAQALISPELNALEVVAGWPNNGMQKDETHNRFGGSLPFTVSCDDELLAEDDYNETFFTEFLTETTCQQVAVNISMDTQFFGIEDTSLIAIEFARQPPDSFDESIGLDNQPDWMAAPSLEDLSFFSDGEVTRLLTGEDLIIRFRLGSQNAETTTQASLAYRLEGMSDWTPLELQRDGLDYTARLPVMAGSHLGSLQLVAEDERGHRLSQTLNSVFYLGREAEAEIQLPPFFGAVGEFTMEATGAVTDLSLFSLMAMDPYGGAVTATLEGEPLFALGTHELTWKALGSTGLEAFATQTLHVVDTTPPALSVPTTSTVEVSAGGTADNPASPSALDIVDGEITPEPDKTGPFAEGTHTITWTASDNSGNTTTTIQTLTVTTPAPAPTPVATSNNSSGGGSFSFWWLLCLALAGRIMASMSVRSTINDHSMTRQFSDRLL